MGKLTERELSVLRMCGRADPGAARFDNPDNQEALLSMERSGLVLAMGESAPSSGYLLGSITTAGRSALKEASDNE